MSIQMGSGKNDVDTNTFNKLKSIPYTAVGNDEYVMLKKAALCQYFL